jgi:protein-S-isoprenylcysteine O-methyltransferase Ste14
VSWVAVQLALLLATGVAPVAERGHWPAAPVAAGVILLVSGAAWAIAAVRTLGRSLSALPQPRRDAELITSGPYRLVRHPIYTGMIAIAAGWSLALSSWAALALAALLAIWLDAKSRREEALLRGRYTGYDAYARRVRRRLVPFLR